MKKILCNFFCLSLIVGFISFIPFFPRETEILSQEKQEKLKEGKTFWMWDSPHGPLAMHYKEKGSGSKHIILLHGFRANTFTWRHLIDPLAEAGYHIWVIDLIGFGLSDKPIEAPYDLKFFLDQIEAFMDKNLIPKAHLVGNSMGGGLAINMAISHPDRVNSLTLIAALGYPLDLSFYLIIGKNFGPLLTPFLGPTIIRKGMEDIVYRKETISDEQIIAYSLPYQLPGGATAATRTLENFDNQHLLTLKQFYPMIKNPVLVIWGDKDKLIPLNHYERFLKDFPTCEHLLIKNCGHIPQEEAPQEVTTAIINFLNHPKSVKK